MTSVDARPVDPGTPIEAAEYGPAELHREHYAGLVRMAALMTDSRALAEEIVQDAFAELVARWSRISPEKALGYLRAAVANGARSALRRRRTVRRHPPDPLRHAPASDESVLRAAGFDVLLGRIAILPMRQRQVLILRYYVGLSVAETATTLGATQAAVTTSARRALLALAPMKDELR